MRKLSRACDELSFSEPVTHVYNPLDYARAPSENYLKRFTPSRCEHLFLGMNPGPWGMAQTGVPFGEVSAVRDWLKISGKIKRPANEHPKRKVEGLECTRAEVSGARFWGWVRERFEEPELFFERSFVWNWCPLSFMEEGGRNRTPDKLPINERRALYELCDEALLKACKVLEPRVVIGIGKFARKRAEDILGQDGPRIVDIAHPSPASPVANRGWAPLVNKQLAKLELELDPA